MANRKGLSMSFTRVPNTVIDDLKLNPYQFHILSIIIRKTDGWCKVEDGISLSQFEKLVSFKKPKIVSTLKELEDMLLIVKTKQQKENGGNSFNLYKIHHTLVTENNKGSNSELQGVVTEDYKQKKLQTKETKTTIPYEEVITYLNLIVGKKFSSKSANNKKLIKARFNEGYTVEDFKQVIDNKYNSWVNTEWAKYLVPDTLFGNKFDKYLNEQVKEVGAYGGYS